MSQEAICLTESEILCYLVGSVEERRAVAIDDHLASCSGCAELANELVGVGRSSASNLSKRLRPRVLTPGALIAGRYLIREVLGVGGMGEVHEAVDQLLGKVVALKTLNAMLFGEERALQRLKAEVALAHRVTHPNVCRTFDLGVDSNCVPSDAPPLLFLTMELLKGDTLASYLHQHTLSSDEVYDLFLQIASGLAAAHDVGVIHRDLKSANVILVPNSSRGLRAVITDFGLAGLAAEQEGASQDSRPFRGTLAWAAPERLAGHRATPASDVYSLGLIGLEMLTGAIDGSGSLQTTTPSSDPGRSSYSRDQRRTNDFYPKWERLITTMTHPDPRMRLQDGHTVVSALQRMAISQAGTSTRWRWAGLLGAATALLALVIVGAAALARRPMGLGPPTPPPVVAGNAGSSLAPTSRVSLPSAEPASGVASVPTGVPRLSMDGRAVRRGLLTRGHTRTALSPQTARKTALTQSSRSSHESGDDTDVITSMPVDDIVRDLPVVGATPTATGDLVDPFAVRQSEHLGVDP